MSKKSNASLIYVHPFTTPFLILEPNIVAHLKANIQQKLQRRSQSKHVPDYVKIATSLDINVKTNDWSG